jgi:hypothetical protein
MNETIAGAVSPLTLRLTVALSRKRAPLYITVNGRKVGEIYWKRGQIPTWHGGSSQAGFRTLEEAKRAVGPALEAVAESLLVDRMAGKVHG